MADPGDDLLEGEIGENYRELDLDEEDALLADDSYGYLQSVQTVPSSHRVYLSSPPSTGSKSAQYKVDDVEDVAEGDEILDDGEDVLELGVEGAWNLDELDAESQDQSNSTNWIKQEGVESGDKIGGHGREAATPNRAGMRHAALVKDEPMDMESQMPAGSGSANSRALIVTSSTEVSQSHIGRVYEDDEEDNDEEERDRFRTERTPAGIISLKSSDNVKWGNIPDSLDNVITSTPQQNTPGHRPHAENISVRGGGVPGRGGIPWRGSRGARGWRGGMRPQVHDTSPHKIHVNPHFKPHQEPPQPNPVRIQHWGDPPPPGHPPYAPPAQQYAGPRHPPPPMQQHQHPQPFPQQIYQGPPEMKQPMPGPPQGPVPWHGPQQPQYEQPQQQPVYYQGGGIAPPPPYQHHPFEHRPHTIQPVYDYQHPRPVAPAVQQLVSQQPPPPGVEEEGMRTVQFSREGRSITVQMYANPPVGPGGDGSQQYNSQYNEANAPPGQFYNPQNEWSGVHQGQYHQHGPPQPPPQGAPPYFIPGQQRPPRPPPPPPPPQHLQQRMPQPRFRGGFMGPRRGGMPGNMNMRGPQPPFRIRPIIQMTHSQVPFNVGGGDVRPQQQLITNSVNPSVSIRPPMPNVAGVKRKRPCDMSNLFEVPTVDNVPDTTTQPEQGIEDYDDDDDEETREYKKKVAEQKKIREKFLQEKEQRRHLAVVKKQHEIEQRKAQETVQKIPNAPQIHQQVNTGVPNVHSQTMRPLVAARQRPFPPMGSAQQAIPPMGRGQHPNPSVRGGLVRGRGGGRVSVHRRIGGKVATPVQSQCPVQPAMPVYGGEQLPAGYKMVRVRNLKGTIQVKKVPVNAAGQWMINRPPQQPQQFVPEAMPAQFHQQLANCRPQHQPPPQPPPPQYQSQPQPQPQVSRYLMHNPLQARQQQQQQQRQNVVVPISVNPPPPPNKRIVLNQTPPNKKLSKTQWKKKKKVQVASPIITIVPMKAGPMTLGQRFTMQQQKKTTPTISVTKTQTNRKVVSSVNLGVNRVKLMVNGPVTNTVVVDNLTAGTTRQQLVSMAEQVGEVKTLNLDTEKKRATITFNNTTASCAFYQKFQKKMVNLSMINVSMVPG